MNDTRIKKGQHLSPSTEFKKGSIPPLKGKKRSKESIEKQKETCRNRTKKEKIIVSENISKASKGKHISPSTEFKKGLIPWNKGKKYTIGIHKTDECKRRVSKKLLGHPLYRCKRYDLKYKGITFRSSWELEFAKYLDSIEETWEYEQKRFHMGDCTYTPDFYLKNFDIYIEIKGHWFKGFKEKINKFKLMFPYKDIVIINYCPPYKFPYLNKHLNGEYDI